MKSLSVLACVCAVLVFGQDSFAQPITNQLVFYSKNGCKGNVVASKVTNKSGNYNCKTRSGFCQNDEARSVFVQKNITLPLEVLVFDYQEGFGGSKTDDYSVIRIWKKSQSMRTGSGVCIPSFEANYGKSWMSIDWNHGNGLDGKVSRIEVKSGCTSC